jgi:rhodanese-related sulfurtransferase
VKFVQENLILIAAAVVSGGLLLWPLVNRRAAGASVNHIAATRLINDSNAQILDVRAAGEYTGGHTPNSKNIPLIDLEKRLAEVSKDKPTIVLCATGATAGKAAATLRKAGHDKVYVLTGGIQSWREAGMPVVK